MSDSIEVEGVDLKLYSERLKKWAEYAIKYDPALGTPTEIIKAANTAIGFNRTTGGTPVNTKQNRREDDSIQRTE